MRCPSCGYPESKVVDSRSADEGSSIRRRRECLECGNRFTTYERLAEHPILVIKTDGSSEVFVNLEAELRSTQRTEIKSKDLGDMVLARLAKLDDVAYIRFASVYKDFQSVEEFSQALGELG